MSHTNQYSISPIAAAVSAALVTPAAALAQEEGASDVAIDNIIVTARKREENLQRIPASVQAIPEAMLKDMGALNTEDYARFVPSLNWINFSSGGANRVVFRGVSTGISNFIATSSASVYLDEIPITATNGSQPEIRMMDIARVEALAGPQGTLFGAAAQAGTLRIITNRPDPSQFEASVEGIMRTGDESDPSHSITGVFNIPLVEDVFAIRIAAQQAKDGGFIDNVFGHTPDTFFGTNIPATNSGRDEYGTTNNLDVVEENWNSVDFSAVRIGARWDINDKLSATLTYNYGDTVALAGNDYNPFVGDLQTIAFTKNFRRDEWEVTSLTIEGDLGFAQFVSATSFLDREYSYRLDKTVYFKYYSVKYCTHLGPAAAFPGYWANPAGTAVYYPRYCVMPTVGSSGDPLQQSEFIGVIEGPSWQYRFTQELRLSHQGETFDWLAGLYYEDSDDNWDSVWMRGVDDYQITSSIAYFEEVIYGCATCSNPGITFPDAEYLFVNFDRTNWEQKAVFGELTWHINAEWQATIGARWFEITNEKLYIKKHMGQTLPNGRQVAEIFRPDWAPGTAGGSVFSGTISEVVPKVSLSWNVSDDKMMYATYTEGYRTGGVNRSNSKADWTITLFPQTWAPDLLANYEIGTKTRWADNTVQLNASFFYMDWEDFQTEVVDPTSNKCVDPAQAGNEPICGGGAVQTWLKIVGNAGDAHVSGVQAELAWVPAEGWDVGANVQWLEAEIDNAPTEAQRASGIQKGQQLPNVPDLQGAAWATYTWPVQFIQGGEMFLRGQYSYVGDTVTKLVPSSQATSNYPSFTNDAYSIADVRLGLISPDGGWQIDLFVNNITDERAEVFQGGGGEWQWSNSEYDHFARTYTNRPREYGLRFSSQWGD